MKAAPPSPRVDDAELADTVRAGAETLGIPLSAGQVDRLVAFVRLIERWNVTYNLTAVRDPREMVVRHVLDCLAATAALLRQRGSGAGERFLDVGSGAGLPGLVVAIVSSQREIVCVDSVGKKAAFITQAAGVLGLANATGIHGRVEAMGGAATFAIIASRAFSSLAGFTDVSRHLLAEGGTWMAMKAKPPFLEIEALVETCRIERLLVPGLSAERCIVWIEPKRAHTYA